MNAEWWGGVLTAFVIGFATNWAFARYIAYRTGAEIRRRFASVVGEYTAYPFPKGSEQIDFADPIGDCQIIHEKDNVLRLRYTERKHDHAWEAVVWMDTPYAGSMAWRYVRLFGKEPPAEHRFGFKRCQVLSKPGPDHKPQTYIYLIGEDTFGKEAWVKKG